MDVGLGHVGDAQAVPRSLVEVSADVAAGVDHDCGARGLTADQVAGVGQVFVMDPFQQHGSGPFAMPGPWRAGLVTPLYARVDVPCKRECCRSIRNDYESAPERGEVPAPRRG